jgi:hypothetical protein
MANQAHGEQDSGSDLIALEAQTYAASIFRSCEHVCAKARFDTGLFVVALRLSLQLIAVSQVVSRAQIVTPGGCSLGIRHRSKHENDENSSETWAGAMQLFLTLDQEVSEVL